MGKKSSRSHRLGNTILSDNTTVASVYNITENIKNVKKLYEMSNQLNTDLTDLLLYYGEKGLSVEDIGVLANIPKQKILDLMSKGEQDYQLGNKSIYADYYRAYSMGLKMFEIETSKNASRKDPMKLLAYINPSKYSDKVTDKYDLKGISIIFGKGKDIEVIDDEESESEE